MERPEIYTDNYNSLEEWIELRKRNEEFVYPQFFVPFREWMKDIEQKSDMEIKELLRILLQPYTLGVDTVSKKIAERISGIKEEYSIEHNCQIGILCRSKGSASKISENLGINNKLFIDNALDSSHFQWSRFFADLLRDYFDEEIFPIDVANRYADEELDRKNHKRILRMVKIIFESVPDDFIKLISTFVKLADLIYPEYVSKEAIRELESVLKSPEQLEGYRPPANNEICIMTLHKSKGLEFDVVFHMDLYDWVFPRRSISPIEYQQDLNLHYVGVTRAKKACYIMQGTYRYRSYKDDYYEAKPSPFLSINGVQNYRNNLIW